MQYRDRESSQKRMLAALLALVWAGAAQALPEDRSQPVHITSDSAVQENTTVTYRGNVIVTQGTLRVEADQVVVHHANGKVQKIVATGKPAHFQQQPEVNGGLVKATAATLVYYQAENRFELLQNAFVERDGASVKGDRIDIHPDTKTVKAQGPSRVDMVFPPETSTTPPPATTPTDSGAQ